MNPCILVPGIVAGAITVMENERRRREDRERREREERRREEKRNKREESR